MKFPINIGFYFDQPQEETKYLKEFFQSALKNIDRERIFEVDVIVFRRPDELRNSNCQVLFIEISEGLPLIMFNSGYLTAERHSLKFLDRDRTTNRFELPIDIQQHRVAYSTDLKSYIHKESFRGIVKEILVKEVENYFRFQNQFEKIWFSGATDKTIYVIGGRDKSLDKKDDAENALNEDIYKYGDKDTFIDTCMFLAKYFNRADLEKRTSDGGNIYDSDHMVIIGGPGRPKDPGNKYCKDMMDAIKSKATYDYDHDYYLEVNGKKLRAKAKADGKGLESDIGYFATFILPETGKRIILINGINTTGVLGAFKAFSDDPKSTANIRTLLKAVSADSDRFQKYKDGIIEFECIFDVKPSIDGVMVPKINADSIFFIDHSEKPARSYSRVKNQPRNNGAHLIGDDLEYDILKIMTDAAGSIRDTGHNLAIRDLKKLYQIKQIKLNGNKKLEFFKILKENEALPISVIDKANIFLKYV